MDLIKKIIYDFYIFWPENLKEYKKQQKHSGWY